MRKNKVVICVDKKELIETMELDNLIGLAAKGPYSGEAPHEFRERTRARR